MYCQNCGKEVNENAYVCLSCGALLKSVPKSKKKASASDCGEWTLNRNRALWTGFSGMVLCMVIYMLMLIGTAGDYYYRAASCYIPAIFIAIAALALGCVSIGLGVTDYNKGRYGAVTLVYSISMFSLSVITFITSWTVAILG